MYIRIRNSFMLLKWRTPGSTMQWKRQPLDNWIRGTFHGLAKLWTVRRRDMPRVQRLHQAQHKRPEGKKNWKASSLQSRKSTVFQLISVDLILLEKNSKFCTSQALNIRRYSAWWFAKGIGTSSCRSWCFAAQAPHSQSWPRAPRTTGARGPATSRDCQKTWHQTSPEKEKNTKPVAWEFFVNRVYFYCFF